MALFRTLPPPTNAPLPSLLVEVCLGLAPDVYLFLNSNANRGYLVVVVFFLSFPFLEGRVKAEGKSMHLLDA